MKLKINKTFRKRPRQKKLKIQRMKTKLENIIFDKLDWMMKLKINNFFTKKPRPKIRNQKNNEWS